MTRESDSEPVFVSGEAFHGEKRSVYDGSIDRAVYKRRSRMAHVAYTDPHFNPQASGDRRGHGVNRAVWVFSEEGESAEGIFESPFELMIDSRLDPHAAIGLHPHTETEEVYYVLEGTLTITCIDTDGEETEATLEPGDAHMIRCGQSHFGRAGAEGARFVVVAVRVAHP